MKPVLIFSGNNNRAVISFCRFATKKNIPIYIVANGPQDIVFKTDYSGFVIHTRPKNIINISDILHYASLVKKLGKQSSIVILPSTEYINRLLVSEEKKLQENYIETGLCTADLYNQISNKYSFSQLCKQSNFDVPTDYEQQPDKFPFVIKPKEYTDRNLSISNPAIIQNSSELNEYLNGKFESDFYYQDYIPGRSIYFLYHISKAKNYSVYSQENLVQQPNGGSMLVAISSDIHENQLSEEYANMLISKGFFGLIMIEFKFHDNRFYMIEANPRLWGPSQLILDAGMNLFDQWAHEVGLSNSIRELDYKRDTYYFWNGGVTLESLPNKQLKFYSFFNESIFIAQYEKLSKLEIYNKEDTKDIFDSSKL